MKPAAFEYYAPSSLAECVELLAELEDEEPRLLAGGQSLVPMMNLRLAQPEVVVDLNRVTGLAHIRRDGDVLAIGAMTRYTDIERSALVRDVCPLLSRAVEEVGYPAVRNRGTLGGSLAHADPVAEMPCVVCTLDGELVVTGKSGTRMIPAADFFTGIFDTSLEPDEVLCEVRLPIPADRLYGFSEFARMKGDYAVVAAAVALDVKDAKVSRAAIGFTNLADRPVRSVSAEEVLKGKSLQALRTEPSVMEEIVTTVQAEYDVDDFRLRLAGVTVKRAILAAVADPGGER